VQIGQRSKVEQITRVLTVARDCPNPTEVFAVLSGCAHGLTVANPPTTLDKLVLDAGLRGWLAERFVEARKQALDDHVDIARRIASIELLRHSNLETAAPILQELLSAAQPTSLQVAAVRALTSFGDPALAGMLLENYRSMGPEAQEAATEALTRSDRVPQLLDALEQDQISFAALPLAQRTVLLRTTNADWKARLVSLAQKQQESPRAKVVQEFTTALMSLTSDVDRGTAVFRRVCSKCHRLEQEGADLGPALETVQHRSAGELLIAILDPSRELQPNYLEYAVVLKDGTTTTGVIAAETPVAITLKKAGAVEQSVLRRDIDEIFAVGKSIMPEGLERELTPQNLADLIAYLRRPH
jgi:putative heme-binding domain-containing protein